MPFVSLRVLRSLSYFLRSSISPHRSLFCPAKPLHSFASMMFHYHYIRLSNAKAFRLSALICFHTIPTLQSKYPKMLPTQALSVSFHTLRLHSFQSLISPPAAIIWLACVSSQASARFCFICHTTVWLSLRFCLV